MPRRGNNSDERLIALFLDMLAAERGAGNDAQPVDFRQCIEDLLADAVAEIFLIFCLAKIEEW